MWKQGDALEPKGTHDSLDDSITGQPKWQSFHSQEIRTRLAICSFFIDSCFAIMFNSYPLLTLGELSIEFPCRNDIFEAETAAEYEHLTMFDSPELRWKTPSQLIKDLLQDTWTGSSLEHVTAMHLMVTICALQSLVMTLRCSLVLEATGAAILRAADRWEDLWRTVTEGSKTRTMTGQGFVEHSDELCWLVRTLVQQGQLKVPDCRYTHILPTDNIKDFHDFLCRYKIT
ncbi:hypothetical protein BGAL_0307g00130 [Botrytis galanthina]|uniref:Xylanolytic transcriptional activator regulatory domain-containing protein n=1 Tax=Botrytis galanthina TaxID=278940 RepID=A0A4S8R0H8_9HELO|nr:hypothetical protein BGAL_0307g00130 [Botrytis galanthina]